MRFAYAAIYMDGAAADDPAATSRDRSAGVVRAFHARDGAATPSGFDPLSLFSAEPAAPAGKPPVVAGSPKPSARRTPSATTWLICGVVIGAAAAIAAPRVHLPLHSASVLSPSIAPVAVKRPAATPAAAIDPTNEKPAPAAPKAPVTRNETAPARSSTAPQAPAFGWVSIVSPFDVEVFEGQTPVGGSGAKVMLAAGRHTVRLVNASLGYDEQRAVSVATGKIARITIVAPKATLDINARPWADVSIDGVAVGETPLAHVPVTIGSHLVVFSHPQLGEQRRTITVKSQEPNRLSVDLRNPQ